MRFGKVDGRGRDCSGRRGRRRSLPRYGRPLSGPSASAQPRRCCVPTEAPLGSAIDAIDDEVVAVVELVREAARHHTADQAPISGSLGS